VDLHVSIWSDKEKFALPKSNGFLLHPCNEVTLPKIEKITPSKQKLTFCGVTGINFRCYRIILWCTETLIEYKRPRINKQLRPLRSIWPNLNKDSIIDIFCWKLSFWVIYSRKHFNRLYSINVSVHTEDVNKFNNFPRLYWNEGGKGQPFLIAIGKVWRVGYLSFCSSYSGLTPFQNLQICLK
jgi:hypothetical protein